MWATRSDSARLGTAPASSIVQTTFTYGDTLSITRGDHSLRVGGEFRRHHLDGDLQERRNRRHNFDDWFDFLTVGYRNPADSDRARQIADIALSYGETVRGFRMTDWNWFVADDWKLSTEPDAEPRRSTRVFRVPVGSERAVHGLRLSGGAGHRANPGRLHVCLELQSQLPFPALPGSTSECRQQEHHSQRLQQLHAALWVRLVAVGIDNVVLRGGYGMFYERITGGFANSLRQSPPFFREPQLNNLGDWNIIPADIPALAHSDRCQSASMTENRCSYPTIPDNEFEAFETQMVPPGLATPYTQQWNLNTQWEFMPNWLLEIGYVGSKGTKLLQRPSEPAARHRCTRGSSPRPGVPGGGFSGNYYGIVDDEFVNLRRPGGLRPARRSRATARSRRSCGGRCWAWMKTRAPTHSFRTANSIYHSLQTACKPLQPQRDVQRQLHVVEVH